MRQPAVYVNFVEDMGIVCFSSGGVRTYYVTPKKYYGLGMNLDEVLVCLRIKNRSVTAGITVKNEYSFDGQNWTDGTTVIAQQTAAGDSKGSLDASLLPPFVRFKVEVVDTGASSEQAADITMWGYYKYRT